MPQSLAALYCHIVFSTKNREPYIDSDLQERLYEYIGGVIRERNSVLVAAGGIADHVHLLVSMSRELAVAPAVRDIKANSSRWVHETFPDRLFFAWQAGYGAFSVSVSCLDQVKAYIANQAEHHRKRTFQEEYRELLRLAGVEFDERYVWD
jgi:putative transposase